MSNIGLSLKQLENRIKQPTAELMAELGRVVSCGMGQRYAIRQTGAPVLAVAHCDYCDCGSDHFAWDRNRVYSSRLDDRLGVYVIMDVLPRLGIHADILLSDDEESGRSSAQFFAPDSHNYNWIFQFDRRGTDAVTYDFDAMDSYASKHFDLGYGSFSDICWLEHLGVCGLNIGTAYYEEHSLQSYAVLSELRQQIQRFAGFYAEFAQTRIEHTPHDWSSYSSTDDDWRDLISTWPNKSTVCFLCYETVSGAYRESEFYSEDDAMDWLGNNDENIASAMLLDDNGRILYETEMFI